MWTMTPPGRAARLAVARVAGDALDLRVHPALVPVEATLATVHGALNAVAIEGALLGPILLSGPGAGAGPTATSVARAANRT